ncbi:MAG: hypothetical protein HY023_05490 [Chloroflexi bacterium]|nr:hypothetical protein [Chloroflexota bacterium]
MRGQVDQSVRIEEAGDTVLAFADGEAYALVISVLVKRKALGRLISRGKSRKRALVLLFAAAVALLLSRVPGSVEGVEIDLEYPGYEAAIKGAILWRLRPLGKAMAVAELTFGRIGKKSPAHDLAWRVHQGKIPANDRVTIEELLEVL